MTDRRLDPLYLDRAIRNISDADLCAEIGSDLPAWAEHWARVAPRREQFTCGISSVNNAGLLGDRDEVIASIQLHRTEILTRADRILAHEINGWGDITIRHGPVVDFNADYGEAGKYGFHYWTWAQRLIHAHLLSGDPRYLAEFDALFNAWYEQRELVKGRHKGLDVIYYELGLGLRNRIFLEYYLLPYEPRSLVTHARMLKTLLGAARWLYEEESIKYRGGNWQIMGAYGLGHIGLMLPEFRESHQWIALAAQRMFEHVERDFFPDGCHSERVPGSYMLVAFRDARNLARLLAAHPDYRDLAERIRAPLRRTIEWFVQTLPPDGIIPAINDGPRLSLPAVLLHDFPELASNPARRSVHLPASGFTALRSDNSADARYMLINHGPTGGGHSHADSLSFELHAFGQALALDAGIGETYDDPHHHTWYVTSRAHNTVTIDESDLDRRAAEGKEVIFSTQQNLDYLAATHHGYEQSKGVIHRRHFAFIRREYFLIFDIIDSLPSATGTSIEWNLHLPAPDKLLVLPSSSDWQLSTRKGLANVFGVRGFDTTSRKQHEIDWLQFRHPLTPGTAQTFAVLLFPFRGGAPPAVDFQQLAGRNNQAHFVIRHPGGEDHLRGVDSQPMLEITA